MPETEETPAPPSGSARAAERRARREINKRAERDPFAELAMQYQQLAEHASEVARDKKIAQKAAEMADTLLEEAKNRLELLGLQIQAAVADRDALKAELDELYDSHPDLVADEPTAVDG